MLATMYKLVSLHIKLLTECFFTNITGKRTGIRTLATMYMLVSLHNRLLTVCFLRYITGIMTLATMYQLVSLNNKLLTECFFISITGKRCWPLFISWCLFIIDFQPNVLLHRSQAFFGLPIY